MPSSFNLQICNWNSWLIQKTHLSSFESWFWLISFFKCKKKTKTRLYASLLTSIISPKGHKMKSFHHFRSIEINNKLTLILWSLSLHIVQSSPKDSHKTYNIIESQLKKKTFYLSSELDHLVLHGEKKKFNFHYQMMSHIYICLDI